jgi:hypothetical protein
LGIPSFGIGEWFVAQVIDYAGLKGTGWTYIVAFPATERNHSNFQPASGFRLKGFI